MDVAEAPRIVFESPAKCADGHRARGLLEEALARARAPAPGWSVTMRVHGAGGSLHADGAITNEHGAAVGHRVFERRASECSGLARAIGVWASLVLDTELHRPRPVATQAPSPPPEPEASATAADTPLTPSLTDSNGPAAAEAQPSAPAIPAELLEKTPPDREWEPKREDGARAIEVGAGAFLMSGAGGGPIGGVTPFVVIEVAKGVFLRPALVFGASLPASGPDMTLESTRFDGCLRVAGLYTSRNGMQLDMCAGVDAGVLQTNRLLPYAAFGPSLDLRGELRGNLAVALRGLFDANLVQVHGDSLDTPLWAGRVELAMSWRLQ